MFLPSMLCGSLAYWQYQRMEWKDGLIKQRAEGLKLPPRDIYSGDTLPADYEKVEVSGVFLHEKSIFVGPRPRRSELVIPPRALFNISGLLQLCDLALPPLNSRPFTHMQHPGHWHAVRLPAHHAPIQLKTVSVQDKCHALTAQSCLPLISRRASMSSPRVGFSTLDPTVPPKPWLSLPLVAMT